MPTSPDGILTAQFDPTRAAVSLVVDGGMWPSPVARITVTRTPTGQPTVPVRGLENQRVVGGWYIGSDHEVPLDTDVRYEVIGYDSGGAVVVAGKTNRFTNPSFETNGAWVTSGSIASVVQSATAVLAGSWSAFITAAASPSSQTSGLGLALGPVAVDDWVAVRIPVRPGGTTPSARARVGIVFLDALGGTVSTVISAATTTPGFSYSNLTHSAQAPAGTVSARAFLYLASAATNVPDANATANTDTWISAIANTQAEALVAVATYFDGNTVGAVWTGSPNASTSVLVTPGASATTVSTTGAEWGLWLKAPGQGGLTVLAAWNSRGDVGSQTIGASYQVHGGNEIASWSGTAADRVAIDVTTYDAAQDSALRALLDSARVLLLQTGQPAEIGDGTGSDWWFVEATSQSNPAQMRSDHQGLRRRTLQLVRTTVPAGAGVVYTGQTYSTVFAEFATYQALLDGTPTYGDLMTGGS